MRACLAKLKGTNGGTKPPELIKTYELSESDVSFLKDLAKRDEFVRQLADSSVAAEVLGIVIKQFAVGPVKLAVQWDLTAIDGWQKANSALAGFNKYSTCELILDHYMSTNALQYFDNLAKARGCQGTGTP
jgi:hypothetical protein